MELLNFLRRIKQQTVRSLLASYKKPTGQVGKLNMNSRDEWVKDVLTSIEPGKSILDAGAGELQYKKYCTHLSYVSQDFNQYDGKGDEVGLHPDGWDQSQVEIDIVSDITSIPRSDASFDVVMCTEVFEHVPHPIDALRELVRLLKPEGTLIITAPFCAMTHFSPYFFHTGFSRHFYEHWLDAMGCEIQELSFNGNYFEFMAQELIGLSYMGERYSGTCPSLIEKDAIEVTLGYLAKMSEDDIGSSDVLSYGLHVIAKKC